MSDQPVVLPDGSAFLVASFPLPADHWIYQKAPDGFSAPPPMPFRMGTDDPRRERFNEMVRAAARYAIRASTMHGQDTDFDPDAMVQNFVVGMLGYHTPDGLSGEAWGNPNPVPPPYPGADAPSAGRPPRYLQKPMVVEAWQVGGRGTMPLWLFHACERGDMTRLTPSRSYAVKTRGGTVRADPGDWIIQGRQGELSVCKDEAFRASYEPAD